MGDLESFDRKMNQETATGPTLSTKHRIALAAGVVLGLLVAVLSIFVTIRAVGFIDSVIIIFLLLFLVGFILGEVMYPHSNRTAPKMLPVGEGASRLDRLCREHGVPVQGTWMVGSSSKFTIAEIFGGIPGNRHLFVEEVFFEKFSREEQEAIITRTAALARTHSNIYDNSLIVLAPLAYFAVTVIVNYAASLAGIRVRGFPYDTVLFLALLYAGAIWYGRRMKYAADDYAVSQTSLETTVRTIEKTEELLDDAEIAVVHYLWTGPSPSKRIERLRKRHGSDASESTGE